MLESIEKNRIFPDTLIAPSNLPFVVLFFSNYI